MSPILKASRARLDALLRSVRSRVAALEHDATLDDDAAAQAYVAILKDSTTTPEETLRRLVGRGEHARRDLELADAQLSLSSLFRFLGDLEGRLVPRRHPVLASYNRILSQLSPERAAVFTHIPDLNYELDCRMPKEFAALLGEDVDQHKWPALFVRIPFGPIASCLSHGMVTHEIGHALAAINAAEVAIKTQGDDSRPEFLPHAANHINPAEVREIALTPLTDADAESDEEDAEDVLAIAKYSGEVARLCDQWMSEYFADSIGTYLLGPAYLLSFLDVISMAGNCGYPSDSHPSTARRALHILKLLAERRVGPFLSALPMRVRSLFESVRSSANLKLAEFQRAAAGTKRTRLYALVDRATSRELGPIAAAAWRYAKGSAYTVQRLRLDCSRFLRPLATAGIPPIGADDPASVPAILNTAYLALIQYEGKLPRPVRFDSDREWMDSLVTRSMESSEAQIRWQSAKEPAPQ